MFDLADPDQKTVYDLLKEAGYGKRTPIVVKSVLYKLENPEMEEEAAEGKKMARLVKEAMLEALQEYGVSTVHQEVAFTPSVPAPQPVAPQPIVSQPMLQPVPQPVHEPVMPNPVPVQTAPVQQPSVPQPQPAPTIQEQAPAGDQLDALLQMAAAFE